METTVKAQAEKFNVKDFARREMPELVESVGDMIVTVAFTGTTLAIMSAIPYTKYVPALPGFYLAAMVVLLLIRIAQRFDDSPTTAELRDQINDRFVELEQGMNERLDKIEENQYPL
jgi:hypothetical protein